jgi:hypothetical protein
MPVETFEVLERERGPRKGKPTYAVPPGQSIRLLGRVSLDGLWPKDVPLLFLVLEPRDDWDKVTEEWELYVASIMKRFEGPARQYRHQAFAGAFGVAPWLRDRREGAFIDIPREWLPLGTFPRDIEADLIRLVLPRLAEGAAAGPGPFRGRMHAFLEEGLREAGWRDDDPAKWPGYLGAGAAMTRPVDLYLPEDPTWGQ